MCIVVFLGVSIAGATHIVGGDFYYRRISNNVYQVTLKLYVDCENGNPQAIQSDQIAIISVWNARTKAFIKQINFTRTGPKYLDKVHYQCLIPPKDVCVSEYVYTQTLNLDPGKDGVILAFQRCCRNNTITNIIAPESTGATYWVKIPGKDVVEVNSSPVFKELPPNYLCTDAPLKFDHSAIDPDGDSLVYELYQPYKGATRTEPRPDGGAAGQFKAPDFEKITWRSPYTTNNQVSGDPIMEINRNSGELTLLPNLVGQYVIGIKVLEYRNGVLIGETLRDYQFNVRKCNTTLVSNFHISAGSSALTYACSDTVEFINTSQKAKNYFWDFGDPTTDADTSSKVNPTWIYPGNGVYLAKLRAWNEICEAEYKFIVRIKSNVEVDLGPDVFFCEKIDRFISPRIFDATRIEWNTGQFGPTIRVQDTGMYKATVFYDKCSGSDSMNIYLDPVEFSMVEDTLFCHYEDVDAILDAGTPGLKYRWNTSFKDTFQTVHVQDTGTYWVKVSNEHCSSFDSTRIFVIEPDIGDYMFICNEFEKQLDAGYFPGATYKWEDGSTSRFHTINKSGDFWVDVTYRHCLLRDSILVENPVIHLELGNDSNYCDSLYRHMVAPPMMVSYLWQDDSNNPDYTATRPGQYYVTVVDTNGCSKSDTVHLTMTNSPIIDIGNDTTICVRSIAGYRLNADFPVFNWSDGTHGKSIEVMDSGWVWLQVIDEAGCSGYDSVYVSVDPEALPNNLFIPNAFSPNGDNLNEVFPFKDLIPQPEYRVRIFNRWGEKLFDSELDGQQWDATHQGKLVEPEAYVYMIEYRACNGEKKRTNGTVTVME